MRTRQPARNRAHAVAGADEADEADEASAEKPAPDPLVVRYLDWLARAESSLRTR